MANENVNQTPSSTSELAVRREKLNNLYASGNNPFEITKFDRTHEAPDAIALFEEKESTLAEGETINVRLAGRMVSITRKRGEGMALLAAYMHRKEDGETMEDYLQNKVFSHAASTVVQPDPAGVAGFQSYLERYCSCIPAQHAAANMK